jgi:hypothetical protein
MSRAFGLRAGVGLNILALRVLDGTEFGMSTIGFTVFAATDPSTAKGLETVRHLGPSTIGVNPVIASHGRIAGSKSANGCILKRPGISEWKSRLNGDARNRESEPSAA